MALIVDPDLLSQGTITSPSDAAFTGSTGATTTITGTASLPAISAGDFFEVRDHSVAGNNGLYVETGGTPTTSSITADKVDGVNPVNAAAEPIRTFHTNATANDEKSVMIDTSQKRIYLLEQGNLSVDGVTMQALYSFLKEEWKADPDLIPTAFPIISITPEQFEFIDGWEPRDVTSPAIQSKKLIRTAGWSEVDVNDVVQRQYMGAISLGTFEDPVNDNAYYALGNDPTDTGAAVDFTFAGPVNEAVKVYESFGQPGSVAITGNNTITKSGGASFITFGFKVGGQVTITDAEDAGNNGTWLLTAVTADVLTVSGTPLTNNAADTTIVLAADNRNAVALYIRVRDGDTNGKTFDKSTNNDIGFATVDNKAFRFPLQNATDLNISATDATITTTEPWTEVRIRYLSGTYNREVDSATKRNFGIVIDVGTYSKDNGASAASTLFTSAALQLGTGEALTDYTGGSLIIHEGTDQGTHTIVGTPVNNAGTLEITLSAALTASESNLSFTMERATPLTATKTQIYEKVQWSLRQAADIDDTTGVVTGRTADELLTFVGPDLQAGAGAPANPNGGGSGVMIEGFDANDTNNLFFFDNTQVSRNFPFVAAGSITFNPNLVNDTAGEFWMFFEYTTRTALADGAVVGPTGSTYDLESPGSNLPALSVNDYINVQGFANPGNNGLFVVTVVNVSTQDYTVRRIDGGAVGAAESGVSITVDQNPINTPQAIIVQDNSSMDIVGNVAASVAFDFDYDNNAQGGRTPGTDAAIVIRAIGLETGQFAEVFGTIIRAVGQSFSVVAPLERNYSNP